MEPARIGILAGVRSIESHYSVLEGPCVLHETWRTGERAHHRARLVRLRVVQHRADRVRELARLAAELPVAVARAPRALRNAQRHDELVGREDGGEDPGDEGLDRRFAFA